MKQARGIFQVSMTPTPSDEPPFEGGTAMGRMLLTKTFEGDITGTATGQMLTAMGAPPSNASYVAVERVECTLEGRSGSFMLVHHGVMTPAGQQLSIEVSPASGTGELAGISGTFELTMDADKVHHYTLSYALG